MKRLFIFSICIILSLSIFGCNENKQPDNKAPIRQPSDQNTEGLGFDTAEEFKDDMQRRYSLKDINIVEDSKNKSITVDFYFELGPAEMEMEGAKLDSFVYYKQREKDFDKITVNIYSQNDDFVKVYNHENGKWTEKTI